MAEEKEWPPRKWLDQALRQALRHPECLRALLGRAVPELAPGFVCERAHLLDREFPLDDWRHREADLPFEVPYRMGEEELLALVCVLIEHQSDTDPLMPLRLLYFAVCYWDRQWQQWTKQPRPRTALRLNPVLPIVLYTGATPWGSNRTLAELLGEPEAFHVFAPRFEPLFWNLADQTAEGLLQSDSGFLQTLAVLCGQNANTADFQALFGEAMRRLGSIHGRDQVEWYDLVRLALTWALTRRPDSERDALKEAARINQPDAEIQREVQTMTKTIAEAWMEEGEARGELRTMRDILRRLLEKRFPQLPQAILDKIEAQTDVDRLRQAVLQVEELQKPEDLPL
jgi:hypothetical protein